MYATPNYVRFQGAHRPELFINGQWIEVTIAMFQSIMSARPPKPVRQAIARIANGKASLDDFALAQDWIARRYAELYGDTQQEQ